MGRVSQSVLIGASLADVWALYFRSESWPAWVDGFGHVEAAEGYPRTGGTLRWRSTAAGRGTVHETVLVHEPRRMHRVAFADPESEGELEVTFAIEAGTDPPGTRVTQTSEYRISVGGPLRAITDLVFVRPQVRRSLARSLARLRAEAEAL